MNTPAGISTCTYTCGNGIYFFLPLSVKSIVCSKSYHLRGPEGSVFSGHETGRGAVHQNRPMVKRKPSFLPNNPVQFSPVMSILKIKLSNKFEDANFLEVKYQDKVQIFKELIWFVIDFYTFQ